MTDVKGIYATVTLNSLKLTEFVNNFVPGYLTGKTTWEYIEAKIYENLSDLVDIKIEG